MTTHVSVILPVYNAERYLKEAIESILNQTYTDFEFIIINDGSTDTSEEIILSFNDSRIRYIKNNENLKVIASLNKGISLSKGKYIVRMDADDIAYPNRIEEQVKFMEANPEIGVCASFVEIIGGKDNGKEIRGEASHNQIQFKLFFSNYLEHPSVTIRKSVLESNNLNYENYLHAEDYKLWVEISKVSKLHILPKVLLKYRVHENNLSVLHVNHQSDISRKIRKEQIDFLGIKHSPNELEVYETYLKGINRFDGHKINDLFIFFKKLIDANNSKNVFNIQIFNTYFAQSAWDISCLNTRVGFKVYRSFFNNNFNAYLSIAKTNYLKFMVKALFKYQK